MNSRTRIQIAACTIICCLLLAMAASTAISAPYKIYWEIAYWQGAAGQAVTGGINSSGNPMAHAQQLIDGNKSIIAQGNGGVLVYADEQTNGTAFVKSTSFWAYPFDPAAEGFPREGIDDYSSKGACLLNGRLYSQSDGGFTPSHESAIHQSTGPLFAGGVGVAPDGPWGPGMLTGRNAAIDNDANALLTDGTYLYGSWSSDGGSSIYKWSVDPAANGGTGSITQVWKTDIATDQWFMCIGYYNHKLYAVENWGTDRNIYEIDCATGVATPILTAGNYLPDGNDNGWVMGQIARCGNRIVVAAWSGHITQWELQGSTWVMVANDGGVRNDGYPDYLLGLSLKPGPDGNAKYAWVSGSNIVYFFDLTPFSGAPTDLADANNWKTNYPVNTQAVITVIGPAGTFWVENQKRTTGAQVAWGGTMPTSADIGKLVTIQATASKNAAGEKLLTAINTTDAVTVGVAAPTAVLPVYMANKTMGPATGSVGLATDGMLVRISGTVKGITAENDGFYIDDGSGVPSGAVSPTVGVKVKIADGTGIDTVTNVMTMIYGDPPVPCTAVVTGVVRLEKIGESVYRRIDARSAADIVITALP